MLNQYPLWKYLLVLLVLVLGGIYAAPNLYPDDPAIQLSGLSTSTPVDATVVKQVQRALDKDGVSYQVPELNERSALVRFNSSEDQLRGKAIAARVLGDDYQVALNLAPSTPAWLQSIAASPMNLGLDLRGGVHFLLEVDVPKAVEQRMAVYISEIRNRLREEKLRYRGVTKQSDGGLLIKFVTADVRDKAAAQLRSDYAEFVFADSQTDDSFFLSMTLDQSTLRAIEDYAIKQNLTTLRNRVNELGIAEPLVQRQGRNRIVVELAGCLDAAFCKNIIGKTANLQFRLEAETDALASRTEVFKFRDKRQAGRSARLEKTLIITGSSVSNAATGYDQNGQPEVNITLDGKGGKLMSRATHGNIGRSMAVLFIEHKTRTRYQEVDGELVPEITKYVEKSIISLATIQSALGNRFRITGLDNPQEASELALLLRAGSLAAPVYIIEERTVGPSLGQENIDLGMKSVQIGLLLVVIFMFIYYRVFGLFANIALCSNLVLLVAVMSMLSATLTLPGIAGIVLTVGMAVDANVLIFARIKEEIKNGLPIQSAIHAGYERAFQTIFDANITTLLVAFILFAVGAGPVKGFAVTLSIGILTSMFTAVVVTRAMANLFYGRRNVKKLHI
jgi:preprotein translocase subunit SecD